MDEKEKYEKVWRECARYGKDWTDRGLGGPYKRPFLAEVPRGSSVTDFGCGNGTSLSWLRSEGFTAAGVEIAANAIKQNADRIHVADLRDEYTGPISEYGICTDLMEHIPTDDVPRVLANISAATKCGVLFGIARLPDKDGDAMGLTLHLTIKDREWWDEHILKYFAAVREIRYDDGVYLLWAFH